MSEILGCPSVAGKWREKNGQNIKKISHCFLNFSRILDHQLSRDSSCYYYYYDGFVRFIFSIEKYLCMSLLPVCVPVHHIQAVLEERAPESRTGVTAVSTMGVLGIKPGPPEEKPVLLTAE